MSSEQRQDDLKWMFRALGLAKKGFTPPNPMVGCVIVKEGKLVGEGFHPYAGQPHAEVFALREAGEQARGATAYVTLEPCCHWGRTPPCTEALIKAGIARVVAATQDSDPRVGGKGLSILRAAGVAVEAGLLEARARQINESFFHFHSTGSPFVTLKAAMTLDGKIATKSGHSRWVTSEEARAYAHKLRAQSGAVMAGIGTLLADDPALTSRLDPLPLRQPLRIIVDSHLRTPPDAQAVSITRAAPQHTPLLIATCEQADSTREAALRGDGVEIARFPSTPDGRVDLTVLMRFLAERQIISVLVDGGGELHAALLTCHLAHKALFFIAPKIVGGRDSPTPVEGEGISTMSEAILLDRLRIRRFGPDIALEGYFKTLCNKPAVAAV